MDASLHEIGIGPIILHDIDFAAIRPGNRDAVGPHHPERRPHTGTGGQFGAPLDAPIQRVEEALSLQAGGRIIECVGALDLGVDVEQAAGNVGVVGAPGVVFEFIVAPAEIVAGIVRPLGVIDIGSGDAVELVAPDERQGLAVGRRCPGPEQTEKEEAADGRREEDPFGSNEENGKNP